MPRRSMRLDLRGFQRQKLAGAVLIGIVVVAAGLAAYLMHRETGVAKYYLNVNEHEIPNEAVFQREVIEGSRVKPVAVMFESPTCPVCKRMAPYWAVLEKRGDDLPVRFYHVMLSSSTFPLFDRYKVDETPTFIVFVDGKPVLRHIGAFLGQGNISDIMLAWALAAVPAEQAPRTPKDYAEQGLRIYNSRCASCHGRIAGLDKASLETWLENAEKTAVNAMGPLAVKALRERMQEAIKKKVYLHEVYQDGWDGLTAAVRDMRKYLPDLLAHEIERTSYLLDYASAVLEDREPPVFPWMKLPANVTVSQAASGGEASPVTAKAEAGAAAAAAASSLGLVGIATAVVAGVVSVFSPCVLPLLLAQVSVVAKSGRRLGVGSCVACGIAAALGVMAIGGLFLVASGLASSLQHVLLPVVALAIVAAGLASLLGVPVELQGLIGGKRRGLIGFCTVYGLLAVQCNLPIVVGVLLLIAGLGLSAAGLAALAALMVGSGVPLALVMWAVSRGGASIAERLLQRNELLSRIGGGVLLAAGLYLLLYSFQLIA